MKRLFLLLTIGLVFGTSAAHAQNNPAQVADPNRDRFDRTMVRSLSNNLTRSRTVCTAAKERGDANTETFCAKQAKDEENLHFYCDVVISRGGDWASAPCNTALENNP